MNEARFYTCIQPVISRRAGYECSVAKFLRPSLMSGKVLNTRFTIEVSFKITEQLKTQGRYWLITLFGVRCG